MKKTITAITLLAGAVAGYSQGQITFSTYIAGTFIQRIYAYSASDTAATTPVAFGTYATIMEQVGSTPSGAAPKEKPIGTTVYNGAALSGTGYDAELLSGSGTGLALANLSPVAGSIVNFATGAGAGLTVLPTINVTVTPVANGPATIAIAAWNNEGGTVTSLASAQQYAAAHPGSAVWGISPLSSFSSTGGSGDTLVPNMTAGSNQNLSFALGMATPEPSTIALGVMGASALLFRRRK